MTLGLLALAVGAYFESVHSLQKDATHEYLNTWNSDYMLRQRKILAKFLLERIEKINYEAIQSHQEEWPYYLDLPGDFQLFPKVCRHWDDSRYIRTAAAVSRFLIFISGSPSNPQVVSAFETVRTFFEGFRALRTVRKDFTEHDVFEAFSLPAETVFWTTAVSGWLVGNLPRELPKHGSRTSKVRTLRLARNSATSNASWRKTKKSTVRGPCRGRKCAKL